MIKRGEVESYFLTRKKGNDVYKINEIAEATFFMIYE